MNRFWCCYIEGTGGFHKKHESYQEAKLEAERLARKEGRIVYILEAVKYGYVEVTPIRFKSLEKEKKGGS